LEQLLFSRKEPRRGSSSKVSKHVAGLACVETRGRGSWIQSEIDVAVRIAVTVHSIFKQPSQFHTFNRPVVASCCSASDPLLFGNCAQPIPRCVKLRLRLYKYLHQHVFQHISHHAHKGPLCSTPLKWDHILTCTVRVQVVESKGHCLPSQAVRFPT